jgi:hypothetical protein
VIYLHGTGTARGRRFDNLALYRYEFRRDGTVVRVRTYDENRMQIEAFWAAVGPTAGLVPSSG